MNDEWFTADSTHLLGPFVKETHDGGVGQRFRVLRQPPFSFFPHDIFMEIPVVLRDFQGQQDSRQGPYVSKTALRVFERPYKVLLEKQRCRNRNTKGRAPPLADKNIMLPNVSFSS